MCNDWHKNKQSTLTHTKYSKCVQYSSYEEHKVFEIDYGKATMKLNRNTASAKPKRLKLASKEFWQVWRIGPVKRWFGGRSDHPFWTFNTIFSLRKLAEPKILLQTMLEMRFKIALKMLPYAFSFAFLSIAFGAHLQHNTAYNIHT